MFLKPRARWSTAREICGSKRFLRGLRLGDLAILDAVWEKEAGTLGRHCKMIGVDDGYIIVSSCSSAAASEITLRSRQIVRNINKYFKEPWIKAIKIRSRL